MSKSLTIASMANLPTTAAPVDLSKYGGGTEFLGRLQLVNPQSKYVSKGVIQAGNWGIPGSEGAIEDLGSSVDIIPLAVREKAMDVSGEAPVSVFSSSDPLFMDIVDRAKNTNNSGCMFGPSLLVFEKTTGRFLELFLGNASGRFISKEVASFLPINEETAKAQDIKPRDPAPCTLNRKLMERPRTSWYAPTVGKCSSPFDNIPDIKEVVDEVTKFVTETSSDSAPEVASTEGRSR